MEFKWKGLLKPFSFFKNKLMEEFIIRKQISVRAPMRHVWHALTDPDLTRRYFYGCKVSSNWMADGPISFKRKILGIFPMELSGKIIRISRGSLLQYSLKNTRSSSESIVTFELYEDNGRTIVSVTDDVGQGEGAEDRYNRSVKGWDKILIGLKHVVENELNG
jgi:uncharacterized protein YndB with AHSA1/START domain